MIRFFQDSARYREWAGVGALVVLMLSALLVQGWSLLKPVLPVIMSQATTGSPVLVWGCALALASVLSWCFWRRNRLGLLTAMAASYHQRHCRLLWDSSTDPHDARQRKQLRAALLNDKARELAARVAVY